MIGIVLVSHSQKLAEGVKELAVQMVQDKVRIEVAAGVDNDENPIGTDPMKVMQAIENAYQDDDVLVLMDLGSALMNAEMGVEFLPEEIQQRVHLCAAPLVEGTLAAAVQAMLGLPIDTVIAEAQNALQSKRELLGENSTAIVEENTFITTDNQEGTEINFSLKVPNAHGLHARPASKMVLLSKGLDIVSMVSTDRTKWVDAKSMNSLSLLGAKQGETLYFRVKGKDVEYYQNELADFQKNNFGDEDILETSKVIVEKSSYNTSEGQFVGIPSSGGIAIAKTLWIKNKAIEIKNEYTENTAQERSRFTKALQMTSYEMDQSKIASESILSHSDLEIFDAHISFLEDKELKQSIYSLISENRYTAEKAWFVKTEEIKNQYKQSKNDYTRERATDIEDIQIQLLRKLIDVSELDWSFEEPVILLADNLQPSDTLKLDPKYVKGFILREGNENSHTAILARSLGIPAVSGVGTHIDKITKNQEIILNGNTGLVITDPKNPLWQQTQQEKIERDSSEKELKYKSFTKAKTTDGITVDVEANISGVSDASLAATNGADGVGLFRTELFFMNKEEMPTEDEQYEQYCRVARRLNGTPLTIRTLDVGGDKPISYIKMPKEDNPFLGLRGIRFSLKHTDIFRQQIRAILRASAEHSNIRIMFPMISSIYEWYQAKRELNHCKDELKRKGVKFNNDILCGMMVEVPSVVVLSDNFANEADFLSIGTNDLSQYLLAADRGNSHVKDLITELDTAVLNAIKQVCRSAEKFNKPISVCGELASKEKAIPYLIKYGIRKLSVNALQIPNVKKIIRETTTK
ncbi:MAG: phosphoenolpyruvate--protein phosphotransferase [Capnocytophaga sp.]|nr:phosphoenolpyruvate--protein phosphotransferase [Capnocytophaga sp.]